MSNNGPDWGKPQFASHAWAEPIVIIGIMLGSCYVNRRTDVATPKLHKADELFSSPNLDALEDQLSDDLSSDDQAGTSLLLSSKAPKRAGKRRNCCGLEFETPDTTRYASHWHSRVLQKFPFLIEFFYWGLNYLFYIAVKPLAASFFTTEGLWPLAETHGAAILNFEHRSIFSFLFPWHERDVQQFFMNGHQDMLTFLNRMYSLIHIPVTVSFLSWYYYSAPNHEHFAAFRRRMTLTNIFSFTVFLFYPCMPPRLLPQDYGFFDTVRHEDAQSIWASGKFFNQLAAFPSLHFGYAFCIGTALMHHSGIFGRRLASGERRISKFKQALLAILSITYPAFVLTIIVATANHYWLDAMAATLVVAMAWAMNRMLLLLLPAEDLLLYCLKLTKPIPTTGSRQW